MSSFSFRYDFATHACILHYRAAIYISEFLKDEFTSKLRHFYLCGLCELCGENAIQMKATFDYIIVFASLIIANGRI